MAVNSSLAALMTDSYEISDENASAISPLWMITQEPAINELVVYLQNAREKIRSDPNDKFKLEFSSTQLSEVREAFSRVIREGERHLHMLCRLFCSSLLDAYQMQSVVVGEVASKKERFTIVQPLNEDELLSVTDLDLGTRQLREIKMYDGSDWITPSLVANVVDYQPFEISALGIHRITSRIKAEEEIWNKVVDEIFNLDTIVSKDKELRRYSRYVKDIFGVKFVVARMEDVYRLQTRLNEMTFSATDLQQIGLDSNSTSERLSFLEVKNYLNNSYRKQSGWEALKSVVIWSGKTFELQVQPLSNFLFERESLTKESHSGFKATREDIREKVAARIPLFGFYRDLLKWLFLNPHVEPPAFPGVSVVLGS